MRWWRRRRHQPSAEALEASRRVDQQEARVERVVEGHRAVRDRNQFAEQIQLAMRGNR